MALELIQNADDAKAEAVGFDITDKGLVVVNSGRFSYCGDLHTRTCEFSASNNYSCDYHRIADVGSGGKLSRGDNIGRFGIGFVSTYQVTDHPEIRSSGVKLTLRPEEGQWFIEPFEQSEGTKFFLPWADDPNTTARLALGVSHVSPAHIDQLAEDFQKILRKSLLFLRHVRTAEVRRNGKLLLACDLDRGDGSELIVSFRPSGEVEQWHVLRADVAEHAARLYASHPRLEALERGTKISIGLRIDPKPLEDGVLYAFLPTEQSTGLPMHINADFFPESDRKAIIFAGHQHEQAWNEMLIDAAATELARDPAGLLKLLGDIPFWQILERAFALSKPSTHPNCFKRFWEQMMATAANARIALAHDGSLQCPSGVFFSDKTLNRAQVTALREVGGQVVAEDLRQFRTVINQLGAPILTFERLVTLLERTVASRALGTLEVTGERLASFYRPLWGMVNDLLPDPAFQHLAAKIILRLADLSILVTEDLYAVTIDQSFVAPATLVAGRVAVLLPKLAIASQQILEFTKIAQLIPQLELGAVTDHITSTCATEALENVIGVGQQDLHDLYAMFAELDRLGKAEEAVYQELRGLPIWLSGRGLIKATHALLPGSFTDPTGQADLLDTSVLTDSAREFVSNKLGVLTQTVEAFVHQVLPRFFNDEGPLDAQKCSRLIIELANHPALLNDEAIRQRLGTLAIVPTQDGLWSCPTNTYRRTDGLVRVLGDAMHLWIDPSRLPDARNVHAFIDGLGIRRSAKAQHLVDRMLFIAEKFMPTEEAKRASGEAFYVLCEHFDEWKEKNFFQDVIKSFRGVACFPAEGDMERWHPADSLYAPYRAEAFKSQANILDFRNTSRLKTELLEDLDVTINPETQMVINHLKHCVEVGTQPHVSTYLVLNERAQQLDPLIPTLADSHCIYVDSQKAFIRPNQLYWTPQQLGRYAFTIPGNLEAFKPLFTAIGVKNAPEGRDFVGILLEIVGEYFEQSKVVTGADRAVYDACLIGVSVSDERGEIEEVDIRRLQEAPTILNLKGQLTHPDEVLLQDSEWHAGFFNGELDRALCKPVPELWEFVEKVGVRRLSESAEVALEFIDGPESDERQVAEKLMDRMDILARLLHDKSTAIRKKIRETLSDLTAVSYGLVRIQASVQVGGDWTSAPPAAARAFYDLGKRQLILARPVGDSSWPHVLNAIFHQLMPDESGSEISKLILSARPLMSMPVDEAHRQLTDAGIPYLDAEGGDEQPNDLTSSSLGDMGSATDASNTPEDKASTDTVSDDEHASADPGTDQPKDEPHAPPNNGMPRDLRQSAAESTGAKELDAEPNNRPERHSDNNSSSNANKHAEKSRPEHKEQWDRRLLSYVRQRQEESAGGDEQNGLSEHNLAVEVIARAAVCAYERDRGRVAEQMAQTHPGYDIISRNQLTGEERFIEVKGVNGEWNQTGVGLSRLQFSNAQDYGDRYWLYVVEFVSDPEHIRVHPICSPATQITSFMFDGNWRDAVTDERADPSLQFVPGVRIHHEDMGSGEIRNITSRGSIKLLSILFDGKSQATPNVTLNLHRMRILGDVDDDNNS